MTTQRLGLIMNGVTGRMGLNQHLIRSILAIRQQGGVELSEGPRLFPHAILGGANGAWLEQRASDHGIERSTTDLRSALSDPNASIYFAAQVTRQRAPSVEMGIAAG